MKVDQPGVQHLDDQTLRMILDCETEHAESLGFEGDAQAAVWQHFERCEHCQSRLVEVAATSEIREQLSSVLRENGEVTSGLLAGKDFELPRPSKGQEYKSIEQALCTWLSPGTHPELLGRLDRYEVESILGWGGMGVVLKAQDSELRRPVAIKMLLPRWVDNGTAKQRFLREARSAAAVLHPSVIAIHGIHQIDDMPYLVMPLIVGPSLQQLVQQTGPLPERQVVQIALQIASGLAAAHAQGVIHRDIKPGNILLDNSVNRAVITDFGLARCQDDQVMTQTGWMAGTPAYMSPEQCRGEALDGRSDLFSLGAVLYFLCSGRSPFTADSPMAVLHQITHGKAQNVRRVNEEVSTILAGLIDRLLKPRKENRFASAADVEVFLQRYMQHLHAPTTNKRPRLKAPLWKWAAPVVTLVLGTVALLSVYSPGIFRWGSRGTYLPASKISKPSNTETSGETNTASPPTRTSSRPIESTAGEAAEIDARYQLVTETQWQNQLQQLDDDFETMARALEGEKIIVPQRDFETGQLDFELNQLQNAIQLPTTPPRPLGGEGAGG